MAFGLETSPFVPIFSRQYEQEFDIEVMSSNGNMIRINTSLGLKIWMKVKMKKSNKSISSIELVEIEDYYCPFCD